MPQVSPAVKIFISWSGEQSRTFAEELKPWLEQVLPGTDVWLSSEDIDKGTIWFTEIIGELERCNCGVICITRENHLAPWIHFEAGGMVKGLGKSRVATILLDIDYPELQQPLNQFNGLRINSQSAFHLVKSFNKLSDRPIKDRVLERTFEKFWPDLDNAYKLLFPDSHENARNTDQPVHIVPKPTDTILAPPVRRKRRKSEKSQDSQPGLFNGMLE
ncbi:MAG TPA: toll/interleukin-1 receptor domain-containing protein [Bryobacteraceae bacterium]|nr:toll/interleukin-1 receptor domain-containing protein [Bryobacteraceae bacterium]